jgi:hypothetical protein
VERSCREVEEGSRELKSEASEEYSGNTDFVHSFNVSFCLLYLFISSDRTNANSYISDFSLLYPGHFGTSTGTIVIMDYLLLKKK